MGKKFMHRDFHSRNILYDLGSRDGWNFNRLFIIEWKNNEIYGVIPYIVPEIFKESKFSQKADTYGFGMIMWELTTSCKPFTNVKHDIHPIM
ncbi:kinase-like domain-containing protein [Rhizophagus irregularis DAOM 181602=DAOM 197198]|uniref:Protein kinase domain-containing protein n=1 Tax=Rhizophagus irregularis (strain DAOM 197198w) TaxID=1432141 RepID=A0A015IEN6_RHIIW|nr:hypothetical protein RirG_253010 [Rhizophagus irregularis DAOM 197198w]GBC52530.2 kinase-like domain-containing protein [Rhizophagus irregularis DAOM 181602=DAOM 197198]